ncbi:hypothetical protein VNO80_15581 [Phaseolus coccineus]|uniref:Uncharacterized protein n=1 Tax=Phaseolus coccineus TaxID=3886 RepID=A0AAN9R1Y1_PHACN
MVWIRLLRRIMVYRMQRWGTLLWNERIGYHVWKGIAAGSVQQAMEQDKAAAKSSFGGLAFSLGRVGA